MKVTMLSRFFDYRTAGLARIANELRAGFTAQGIEVKTYGARGPTLKNYLRYLLWDIPLCFPYYKETDIYHAITPMEGIYTPWDRTVVTVPDLIMVKHPEHGGSGVGTNPMMQWGASRFAKWGYGRACHARYLACISEETKADLIEVYKVPEERIRVIRLGIGEEFEPNPVPHDTLRIGYLGQLDRRKRVHLLIEGFKVLKGNDYELWVAGIGPEEAYLKVLAGSDTRIKFKGKIPDDELVAFYNSLDCFAFPTAVEGYGLPPVEAMACKLPVFVWPDAIMPDDVYSRCANIKVFPYWREGKVNVDIEANYQFAKSHSWASCIDSYIKLFKEIDK